MLRDGNSTRSTVTVLKTLLFAGVLILLGLSLMWVSDIEYFESHKTLKDLVNQVGGVLITTGAIAVLWDFFARKELMNEVLEKVHLSDEVVKAGISQVFANPQKIPWNKLIDDAQSIDAFIAYGRTWYAINAESIRQFVASENRQLNLYLPDPNDQSLMTILAQRTDGDVAKLKQFIADTVTTFRGLQKGRGSAVTLHYRRGYPTYAAHRFDRRSLVITFYRNTPARADVPTLLLNQGTFLEGFFQRDLDDTAEQSQPVP